jgi:hypothetical protein
MIIYEYSELRPIISILLKNSEGGAILKVINGIMFNLTFRFYMLKLIRFTTFFCILFLFFSISSSAQQAPNLYWNGIWDRACEKCWPTPQSANQCSPADCIMQGWYTCEEQTIPLKQNNDLRLIGLILKNKCTYVDSVNINSIGDLDRAGVCDVFDSLSGKTKEASQTTGSNIHTIKSNSSMREKFIFAYIYVTSFFNPAAKYLLATFYDLGFVVNKDKVKATRMMQESAERGFREAQYAMGVRYYYGITVPANFDTSLTWFKKVINSTSLKDKNERLVMHCASKYIYQINTSKHK